MKYKKQLIIYITNYPINTPIFIEEIKSHLKNTLGEKEYNNSIKKVYVYINRMVKNEELNNYAIGIYYKGTVTKEQVIEKKYIKDKAKIYGYFTGNSLLFKLGLIKDKPEYTTLISNVCYKGTKYKNNTLDVIVRKSKIEINNDNYKYLQLLDLIKQNIPKETIYKYIRNNNLSIDNIFKYAKLCNNKKVVDKLYNL